MPCTQAVAGSSLQLPNSQKERDGDPQGHNSAVVEVDTGTEQHPPAPRRTILPDAFVGLLLPSGGHHLPDTSVAITRRVPEPWESKAAAGRQCSVMSLAVFTQDSQTYQDFLHFWSPLLLWS